MDYKKFGKTGLNKRKVVIWIRNVFLAIIFYFGVKSYFYQKEAIKDCDVTICTITGFTRFKKNRVYYDYVINGIKYKGFDISYPDSCRKWDQYKMKYSRKDPTVTEILWNEKVN
jgi:hypothetical protein